MHMHVEYRIIVGAFEGNRCSKCGGEFWSGRFCTALCLHGSALSSSRAGSEVLSARAFHTQAR